METTPRQRRYEAIGAITASYTENPSQEPKKLIDAIAALAQLGRSATWKDAVEMWSGMVTTDECADPAYFRWALYQGAIYTGFKA